jgi:hypothetical protein
MFRSTQHTCIDQGAQWAGGKVLVRFKRGAVDGHAPSHAAGVFAGRAYAAKFLSVVESNRCGLLQPALPAAKQRTSAASWNVSRNDANKRPLLRNHHWKSPRVALIKCYRFRRHSRWCSSRECPYEACWRARSSRFHANRACRQGWRRGYYFSELACAARRWRVSELAMSERFLGQEGLRF